MNPKKQFFTKPEAKKAKAAENSEQEAYRNRAKAERNRFKRAVLADTWLAFCFLTEEDMAQFRQEIGVGVLHERYWVDDLDWSDWKPEKPRRGFVSEPPVRPVKLPPDPLRDVVYQNRLDLDSRAELEALHAALVTATPSVPLKDARLSNIYFVIAFPGLPEKDEWLVEYGITKHGNKYLDGMAVLTTLRRNRNA